MSHSYRVLGFSPLDGWNLRAVEFTADTARHQMQEARRDYQIVAVVLARGPGHNPRLEVVEANVPHPERLLAVDQFRRVAMAL